MTEAASAKKRRRAEPIDTRTAKNGTVTYTFQIDVGTKPDGTRDRQRFTYRTITEARREYRRIATEVADGRYIRLTDLTVNQACDEWIASRRTIRRVTLNNYKSHLKPVRRFFGGRKLAELTKPDGDKLVEWMLTTARVDQRRYDPDSLTTRIADYIAQHPDGVPARLIQAQFPEGDAHTSLSALIRTGRITRIRRAVYTAAQTPSNEQGVKPVTVRTTLTAFSMVVQSYVDQGALPRNVIALVERPPDDIAEHDDDAIEGKSWTVAEIEAFRESVRTERLYACWLLSCYGMRRSEVLAARWTRFDKTSLRVRRGRVAIGSETEENLPKSRRGRRDLPTPPDVTEALTALKTLQQAECQALDIPWTDDRLIAAHEDGAPVRPEWYSDEFQRLRTRAGLQRIPLKHLRNTSVSLMLARGIPPHIVAAWHGHDPAISLSIYSDAHPEDLKAAGAALFE
ncbi:site-specific integrase [Nocardia pseudovaccinii]|uniref:site-specific integrase n=1 Tax=Nocardia pseudovaccinii TaxID=189540 RepID=UPI003D8E5F87